MSWLKQAESINPKTWETFDMEEQMLQLESIASNLGIAGLREIADMIYSAAKKLREASPKKEGSVYNDPEYQAQDLNKGDSGDFSEDAVHDGKPTTEVNPGPGSTVPGSNAPNSPQIPGQDGALISGY